jgi:hypothetical protein
MKDLQEATERICELKGSQIALDVLLTAMLKALPGDERQRVLELFSQLAEVARTVLLNGPVSELTIGMFETDVRRIAALNDAPFAPPA